MAEWCLLSLKKHHSKICPRCGKTLQKGKYTRKYWCSCVLLLDTKQIVDWEVVTCLKHHVNGYDVFINRTRTRLKLYCNECGAYIEFILKEREQ